MPRPRDVAVIDTLVGLPDDPGAFYASVTKGAVTTGEPEKSPISYLFPNAPKLSETDDLVELTVSEMDRFGVERAMVPVDEDGTLLAKRAIRDHPDRFFAEYLADPSRGVMDEVRRIVRLKDECDIKAVTAFPAGTMPPVGVGNRVWFPIYSKCIELGIPLVTCMGVPGPRLPYGPQDVAQLDELCYLLPELTIVTRHGCEPWVDLMVKLMLKWPNLYYSTSGFAPKHYPREIIDYANTRGHEKIIYAGYSPWGVSMERSFTELDDLPLREHVWEPVLRGNAVRVFKL